MPNGNFNRDALVSFPIQKAWNYYKPANGTHSFHSEIPFGTFGLPLNNPLFLEEISARGDKMFFSFTFYFQFPDFLGK